MKIKKNSKWNTFSLIQVKIKKKRSSTRIEHFFPQICAQMYTHSNYWGGCRCGPFSNYWGGYSQIIGGYIPPFPRVLAPLIVPIGVTRGETALQPMKNVLPKCLVVYSYLTNFSLWPYRRPWRSFLFFGLHPIFGTKKASVAARTFFFFGVHLFSGEIRLSRP